MPWTECDAMSERSALVGLAGQEGVNMSELCRRFGISRKTGYKWLARCGEGGKAALADRSRRPRHSPARTEEAMEARVLALRDAHPAWGGRKLRRRLLDLGESQVPAASTITGILRRNGRLDESESARHRPFVRFQRAVPNALWQMDFKGHVALEQGRCHPLTVLDDHSRYALELGACGDERGATVQRRLTALFRRYGLPACMLMDNGAPWGDDASHPYTPLTVWLLRLGVGVCHGRPYHPQTQGKEERFHRTLKAEVLRGPPFRSLAQAQRHFDAWREVYNHQRPHEALDLAVPASRYRISERAYPEVPPAIEYAPGLAVRKVQDGGWISYQGRQWRLPKAFKGYPVALQSGQRDGELLVRFAQHLIARLDLHTGQVRPPAKQATGTEAADPRETSEAQVL